VDARAREKKGGVFARARAGRRGTTHLISLFEMTLICEPIMGTDMAAARGSWLCG
jgi:hypothetical protein